MNMSSLLAGILAGAALLAATAGAQAQRGEPSVPQPRPPTGDRLPAPDTNAPRSGESLSDTLERNDGVVRPPPGVVPDNTIPPPEQGRIRVIPPPGSPEGDPKVRPK